MSLKDRVVEMKEEVEELRKDYESDTFATDLLRELKAQNIRQDEINKNIIKKQHITIIILISVIIAIIIGFFIFIQQFEVVGEESTQETYYTDNSSVTQTIE